MRKSLRQSAPKYLTLSPNFSLRLLEKPCIFDKAHDELYELDEDAFNFVRCLPLAADANEIERADREFLQYCLDERILTYSRAVVARKRIEQGPLPSLRYLLLHITTRCNLKCAHCFLGEIEPLDMPLEQIVEVMKEFDSMQGLRLLVSGGEPLLHPQFWELNELFDRFSFRTVILSNGIILANPQKVEALRADEVQVSLDGIGDSHEILRGPKTYEKTLMSLRNLARSDIDVSVATMIHSANIHDFDRLETIVKGMDAKEWNIDVPAPAGRWTRDESSALDPQAIGPILEKAFGGGVHHSEGNDWACGAHLGAVMADGTICKCGFYASSPVGTIADSLAGGWQNIPRIKLSELRCDCDFLEQCRGGCRYRAEVAGTVLGKDPVMCAAHGLQY